MLDRIDAEKLNSMIISSHSKFMWEFASTFVVNSYIPVRIGGNICLFLLLIFRVSHTWHSIKRCVIKSLIVIGIILTKYYHLITFPYLFD